MERRRSKLDVLGDIQLRLREQEEQLRLPQDGISTFEDWRVIGASGQPAFANGWVDFGDPTNWSVAAFWKDSAGIVRLRGIIRSGSVGSPAFALPKGYRPSSGIILATVSNSAFGEIRIFPNGDVTPVTGSNAWFSLSSLSFRSEA